MKVLWKKQLKSHSLILVSGKQIYHIYFPMMLMISERLNSTYRRLNIKTGFKMGKEQTCNILRGTARDLYEPSSPLISLNPIISVINKCTISSEKQCSHISVEKLVHGWNQDCLTHKCQERAVSRVYVYSCVIHRNTWLRQIKFTREFESQCCLLGRLLKASEHHPYIRKINHPKQNECVRNK